jgi:hypothetical protein
MEEELVDQLIKKQGCGCVGEGCASAGRPGDSKCLSWCLCITFVSLCLYTDALFYNCLLPTDQESFEGRVHSFHHLILSCLGQTRA